MDGIVIINKEKEYTSHDVVAKVKKILKDSRNQAKKKRVIIVENHVMDFVILILFLHFV